MSKKVNKRWKGYVLVGHGHRVVVSKLSECDHYIGLGFEYIGMAHITA